MNDFGFNRSSQPQLVVTRSGLSYDRVRSQPTISVPLLQADMSSPPSGPRRKLFSASAAQQQREPVLPIGPVEDVPPLTRTDPGWVEVPNSDPRSERHRWGEQLLFRTPGRMVFVPYFHDGWCCKRTLRKVTTRPNPYGRS
ncbi:hypothetical protein OUZ56_011644 [Daphnia magna]|uniref:Uncharacterized protein n=1 Tax=Daphnia magna TaxID=35525 RepID=A0ABQ9Z207_9CRUS|nr:hypothetical protein OUZ56_011644 [Daphnia magna]